MAGRQRPAAVVVSAWEEAPWITEGLSPYGLKLAMEAMKATLWVLSILKALHARSVAYDIILTKPSTN